MFAGSQTHGGRQAHTQAQMCSLLRITAKHAQRSPVVTFDTKDKYWSCLRLSICVVRQSPLHSPHLQCASRNRWLTRPCCCDQHCCVCLLALRMAKLLARPSPSCVGESSTSWASWCGVCSHRIAVCILRSDSVRVLKEALCLLTLLPAVDCAICTESGARVQAL